MIVKMIRHSILYKMFRMLQVVSRWTGSYRERKLISQISKDDHNKSKVAKWLKSTDVSEYLPRSIISAHCQNILL